MTRTAFLLLLLYASATGCNSISSTAIHRMETDELVGESNGHRTKHCEARPYKGIPITLRVPTHVDVAIKEKVRISFDGETLTKVKTPRRHLLVESDPVYTAKVFTVDIKRPAAGTANYTLEFGGRTVDMDNSQYFKKLKSRIVDETISDITAALNTITTGVQSSTETGTPRDNADGTPRPVTPEEPNVDHPSYLVQVRTVAWKRFDIDSPDFEVELACFVQKHMNECNSCLEFRSPNPAATTGQILFDVPVDSSAAPVINAPIATDPSHS